MHSAFGLDGRGLLRGMIKDFCSRLPLFSNLPPWFSMRALHGQKDKMQIAHYAFTPNGTQRSPVFDWYESHATHDPFQGSSIPPEAFPSRIYHPEAR